MHILLVEDTYQYRWKVMRQLHKLNLSVSTTAYSYEEAVFAFRTREPDLIICDNDLLGDRTIPDGLDAGFWFIKEIRSKGFRGRIILYTENPRTYFTGELDITSLDLRFVQKQRMLFRNRKNKPRRP